MVSLKEISENTTIKNIMSNIVTYLVVFLIGLGVGMFIKYKEYKPQIEALQKTVDMYQGKYQTSADEKEKALIENAKLKLKEPEKVYIKGGTQTEYKYVQKESNTDADVAVTTKPPDIKLSYNGKDFVLPMQNVKDSSSVTGGTLLIGQQSSSTLDVTDIVNREIANTIMQKDAQIIKLEHEKKVAVREGTQNTVWGVLAGAAGGYIGAKMSK